MIFLVFIKHGMASQIKKTVMEPDVAYVQEQSLN